MVFVLRLSRLAIGEHCEYAKCTAILQMDTMVLSTVSVRGLLTITRRALGESTQAQPLTDVLTRLTSTYPMPCSSSYLCHVFALLSSVCLSIVPRRQSIFANAGRGGHFDTSLRSIDILPRLRGITLPTATRYESLRMSSTFYPRIFC